VSQMVSQLERRTDAQLIDRSTRPLQLTALGQTFYEGCKTLLAQYDELEASIRCGRPEIAGHVRVAAIYSVGLIGHGIAFWAASAVFVVASIVILQRMSRDEVERRLTPRFWAKAIVIGVAAAVITHLVFQELFLVRLP